MPYQASYSGKGPWWAVVKHNGKTVWTSPEPYPRRQHPGAMHKAALDIAARVARALNHPDTRQADLAWIREHGLSQYDIALDQWVIATAEAIERALNPVPPEPPPMKSYTPGARVLVRVYETGQWRPAVVIKDSPYPKVNCGGAEVQFDPLPTVDPVTGIRPSVGGWFPQNAIQVERKGRSDHGKA